MGTNQIRCRCHSCYSTTNEP